MNKIFRPNYLSNDKEYLLFVDDEIERGYGLSLDSNSLLYQLEHVVKAIKFGCGDNEILNNITPKVFLPSGQACQAE